MKPVGSGFGDIVDLRSAVAALVDRVRDRVDGHLGDRIQSQHQIGGKAAVEVGQRVVGLESVDDVAVRKRGQTVELHVAVAVGAAHEVVAAAGGVDERAGGKLQRVGHVAARIRQVFEGCGGESGGGIRVFGVELRRLLMDYDALVGGSDGELEVDRLLQPKTGGYGAIFPRFKAVRLGFHGVNPRLQLGKL